MPTQGLPEGLFERPLVYPDVDAMERLARLVGIDDQRDRLTKILAALVNPAGIRAWAARHHGDIEDVLSLVFRRPPLVVLAGDVGSGKTELAETVADAVARQEGIGITLLPLSLAARGEGRVGEMTKLVSAAFEHTEREAVKLKGTKGAARGAVILLVDEADALAQSRESSQMHHEDRAGVNAFIRGVDRLANARVPAAVVMCTNRLSSLDPAVRRRAADVLAFDRPDEAKRRAVLAAPLRSLGLPADVVEAVVRITGPGPDIPYGFTFSDITQRLLPGLILDAYPKGPVTGTRVLEIVRAVRPTPPFKDGAS